MKPQFQGVRYFSAASKLDNRGKLMKVVGHKDFPLLPFSLAEFFISESKLGVVRGMHLQIGRSSNARVVSVVKGAIFDVLVDLRDEDKTPKMTQVLSVGGISSVYIPPGVAHGYQALDDSIVCYLSSKIHEPELDTGINPLSDGLSWPISISGLSERDQSLPYRKVD